MSDVADNLRKARARIEKPEAWTQQFIALTAEGYPTDPDDPKAVCWCARGTLEAEGCEVLGENESEQNGADMDLTEWWCLHEEARRLGYSSIESFNDGQTHAEVLRLFDRAIARAEVA